MTEDLRYSTVLFDWGGTVMHDHPEITIPMVKWKTVEVIDGIAEVLSYLQFSRRKIILATGASISDEIQIRGALARANLDAYFERIFCFKNTGIQKGEPFYRHVLSELKLPASDALMVGDSFEKDVLAANAAGVFAVWFHPKSDITSEDKLHVTVHSMRELQEFFQAIDQG